MEQAWIARSSGRRHRSRQNRIRKRLRLFQSGGLCPDQAGNFHVASVSKEFTAMAIVLLEQEGKLSLDDDVHKYLPELPEYGEKLTLRNLLQHTSGIRDQWQLLGRSA